MDILYKSKILFLVIFITSTVNAKTTLDITWKEKDRHIIQNSVCASYKNVPRQYRFCRIEAKSLFKSRCQKSRARLEKSKKAHRYSKAYAKEKYCYAARTFMIFGA